MVGSVGVIDVDLGRSPDVSDLLALDRLMTRRTKSAIIRAPVYTKLQLDEQACLHLLIKLIMMMRRLPETMTTAMSKVELAVSGEKHLYGSIFFDQIAFYGKMTFHDSLLFTS